MITRDPEPIFPQELRDAWPALSPDERVEAFRLVPHDTADDFFLSLEATDKLDLLLALNAENRRRWMRLLPPDDAVDVLQAAEPAQRETLLADLDEAGRREVTALAAYAEDDAGGLMNPRFVRVRPDMSIDQALAYLRRQARERAETVYYAYVLDAQQHLLGVVSLRELFQAPPDRKVHDIMRRDVLSVREQTDQEALGRLFAEHGYMAVPVVDDEGRMKGIVTVDDIVQVVQEEATEDIQKLGGSEALGAPYLRVGLWQMIRKRAGWLLVLFLGEMLTATAMGRFEEDIARAVVLTLFVPLIISSGGNSGSQATTLVIRAMALSEVRLRDWWRVARREVLSGLALGAVLGSVGLVRIVAGEALFHSYGEHAARLGVVVAVSLLGVVTFGTVAGSMLPFLLRRAGFDPASASAPFVATLVDVSGLVIYFSVASVILRGTLL